MQRSIASRQITEPAGSRASATAAQYVGAMAAVTGPASATPGRGRDDRGDRRHRPVS